MYDMNDAGPQMMPQGEPIPDGTFAKVRMTIRPGGVHGKVPMDAGLLTAGKPPDVKLLNCEFTVLEGPHARRKFWQNFTVAGGKLDDKGESKGWHIAKASFRAMIDSALGLDPQDMSEAAKQKRQIRGLKDLDGITFVARIMVEPPDDPRYSPSNKLANVVLANEPQYAAVMRGETVAPDPVNAKPRKPAKSADTAPTWAAEAALAQVQTPGPNAWASAPAVEPPAVAAQPAPVAGPAWLNE